MSLDTTIKALQDGASHLAVAKGVKNIEDWMETLGKADFRGAKVIHENLGKLKRHLEADKLDGPPSASCCARWGMKPRGRPATRVPPKARRSSSWANC